MPLSSLDQEDDPFADYDYDVGEFHNTPSSSSTSLDPANSLRPCAAPLETLSDRIEQHGLHSIFLSAALPEVPWMLDSS